MNSKSLLVRISPAIIAKLRFILESYDHLAIITVRDRKKALVEILFYYTEEEEIQNILSYFKISQDKDLDNFD